MIKLLILLVFTIGIIFCLTRRKNNILEGFDITGECPNLLVQKGDKLHLIYKNKAKIPGVNPLIFDNLDEYVEFIKWQRAKGIKCPILYFQETYNTQNEPGYRMLPDPIEKQAGLPSFAPEVPPTQPLYDSNHDDMPYNKNSFAGYDPIDQYVGAKTPLDKSGLFGDKSANAMDTNWCGLECSQQQVEDGKFRDDTRKLYDNPFIDKGVNISYQDRFKEKIKKTEEKKRRTPREMEAIKAAMGGEDLNNPINRAIN